MTARISCGMMVEIEKKEVRRINWEQESVRRVRRSADVIGGVELASVAVNVLLYPLLWAMPAFSDGSFGAELSDLLLYLIVFALPFCVASRMSDMSVRDLMGRGRPPAGVYVMTICLTLGWSFAAGWLGGGMETLLNQFGLTETVDSYVLPTSAAAAVVQFISVAIVPPIVEELCYRGFYLNTAVRSMGTWGAIVLTSFAFWLAHYSVEILPLAFGFGLIGGYIRRRYGSLLPSMCGHFAVNSVYLLINAGWDLGGMRTGATIAAGVNLTEVLLGAVGVALFVRRGCLRELWDGAFGYRSGLTPRQMVRGVLTSLPVLLMLLITIYFTAKNLEAL